MIAKCHAKTWTVQLKEDNVLSSTPDTQRGIHGHIIIYPQRPSEIAQVLPPSINDIITPICVLFVVRREKVRSALVWLKQHNPLYRDIQINDGVLNELKEEQVLPFHVQHIITSDAIEASTSRYDNIKGVDTPSHTPNAPQSNSSEIPFEKIVIMDVDGHTAAHKLKAAALHHMKNGGAYLQIPHNPSLVNESLVIVKPE
ncbi:hypothetical protein BJ165DRAFT_1417671 [Panaeolus papilionaceus]|nr:hypothetical protein BJ165DRAFT_1417671 [Panaeolus papilionaceus]